MQLGRQPELTKAKSITILVIISILIIMPALFPFVSFSIRETKQYNR